MCKELFLFYFFMYITQNNLKYKIFLNIFADNKIEVSDGLLVDNPFFIPKDSDIFKNKEREKELRREVRKFEFCYQYQKNMIK